MAALITAKRDGKLYYFMTRQHAKMAFEEDDFNSLSLMQYAVFVVDIEADRVLKCRFGLATTLEIIAEHGTKEYV